MEGFALTINAHLTTPGRHLSGGTRISPPTRVLISTYVAVPAPTKFVKSIVADWTYLIEILELVCPHAVMPYVVIKLVRVRRQLLCHGILVLSEGINFLLGVSAGRDLRTENEMRETDGTWASFVIL